MFDKKVYNAQIILKIQVLVPAAAAICSVQFFHCSITHMNGRENRVLFN